MIETFLATLQETGCDFTNSFRRLNSLKLNGPENMQADIDEFIGLIVKECRSIEETIESIEPKFKPETLEKLLNAIQENPAILQYYGLSETFVKNEVENMEMHRKIKNWTQNDKNKSDSEAWKIWLTKYIKRIYNDCETIEADYITSRVKLMNKNNPRQKYKNLK